MHREGATRQHGEICHIPDPLPAEQQAANGGSTAEAPLDVAEPLAEVRRLRDRLGDREGA